MASQNTGLFAANFVEGFFGHKAEQKEQEGKNKIIKLQTKLIEQQLASGKIKLDASTKLSDLMTGTVGEFEQVGERQSDIPGTNPAPQFESTGQEPPTLAELMSDPQALLLASQAGFQLPQGQQGTSFSRDAADAGILPGTPEFADAFAAKNRQDPASLFLAQTAADSAAEALVKRQTDRIERTEAKRVSRAEGRIAIRNTFSLVNEAVGLERELRGTALQSGLPGGDQLRSVAAIVGATQEFFGKDSPQAVQIGVMRDRLNKLYAESLRGAVNNLKSARGVTDQGRAAILASLPTAENAAVANVQVLGDMMRKVLDGAEIAGYEDIENRDGIEAFIANPLAGLSPDQAPPAPDQTPPDGPTFLDTATGKAKGAFDTAVNAGRPVVEGAVDKARSGLDAATVFANEQIEQRGPGSEFAKNLDILAKLAILKGRSDAGKAKDAAKEFFSGLAAATHEEVKAIKMEDIANWTKEQRAALEKRIEELGF